MLIETNEDGNVSVTIPPEEAKEYFPNGDSAIRDLLKRFPSPVKIKDIVVQKSGETNIKIENSSRIVMFILGSSNYQCGILISSASTGAVSKVQFGSSNLTLTTATNKLTITNSGAVVYTAYCIIFTGDASLIEPTN